MTIENEIIAKAQSLFDAVGITSYGSDSIIILGMATSPKRDLDDFLRDEKGAFIIRGFEVHVQPRLDSLVDFLQNRGLTVEVMGHCGYPTGNVLNLKQQAVAAGLANWGKNAMVLHPQFGPRFRLMAIKVVGVALSPTGTGMDSHVENPLCGGCTACLAACPLGILEPYYVQDRLRCLGSSSQFQNIGKVDCCDLCWMVCPVGK